MQNSLQREARVSIGSQKVIPVQTTFQKSGWGWSSYNEPAKLSSCNTILLAQLSSKSLLNSLGDNQVMQCCYMTSWCTRYAQNTVVGQNKNYTGHWKTVLRTLSGRNSIPSLRTKSEESSKGLKDYKDAHLRFWLNASLASYELPQDISKEQRNASSS